MSEGFHHRPTLKQQNKRFKSKHATKHSVKIHSKGRVPRSSPKTQNHAQTLAQSRQNRRNAAKQIQLHKRHSQIDAARLFGPGGCARVVSILPLCEDLGTEEAQRVVESLAQALGIEVDKDSWSMSIPRFKTSLRFVFLPFPRDSQKQDFIQTLDTLKISDYTLLLFSPLTPVSDTTEILIRTLQSQGFPSTLSLCVPATTTIGEPEELKEKDHPGIIKSLLSFIRYFIPTQNRVFNFLAPNPSEALILVRALCESLPHEVGWRTGRGWMVADSIEYDNDDQLLKVTGVVRGSRMSANRLVHIPNVGDLRVSKIFSAPLSSPTRRQVQNEMDATPTITLLSTTSTEADERDSLVSTNPEADAEMGTAEQTWPTEEELREGAERQKAAMGKMPKRIKRVPKGTSAYQAEWEVSDESESDSDEEDDAAGPVIDAEIENADDAEELEDLEMEVASTTASHAKDALMHEDLPDAEESAQLSSWRQRQTLEEEEEEEASFPDQFPPHSPDIQLRTRLARYRGLRSMRTSPWDPYENLPPEYGRIFDFGRGGWKGVEKICFREVEEEGAEVGTRCTIHVPGLQREAYDALHKRTSCPLVLFPLLRHEHKMTVLHFKLTRPSDSVYTNPVKSKEPMILCVGPRRFSVKPIYSAFTSGGNKGTNNVHKFERFFRKGETVVATIFGPITWGGGRIGCELLKETAEGIQLVATGTFLNPDTTRIIAKRVILTGNVFKVHKRTATVRYMFFNREDIAYFRPIALHTTHGRKGHIKEPLGTHGYFKATFDGEVKGDDVICMSLYKRVWPRWAAVAIDVEGQDDGEVQMT